MEVEHFPDPMETDENEVSEDSRYFQAANEMWNQESGMTGVRIYL
jgi:hypothetical protein